MIVGAWIAQTLKSNVTTTVTTLFLPISTTPTIMQDFTTCTNLDWLNKHCSLSLGSSVYYEHYSMC